jgi:hypothetical protein
LTDALRGSQSFGMNGQLFREYPAGGAKLKHTLCAALPAPQIVPGNAPVFGNRFCLDCRQTAPYSPELEPDIVLTQPHASGVDETLHTLW